MRCLRQVGVCSIVLLLAVFVFVSGGCSSDTSSSLVAEPGFSLPVVATSETLRAFSVETLPDGTDRQINGLEWALRRLLASQGPESR